MNGYKCLSYISFNQSMGNVAKVQNFTILYHLSAQAIEQFVSYVRCCRECMLNDGD
jgi:hypothetical protein